MDNFAVILLVLLLGTLNTVQCQYEETKSEDFEGSSPSDDIPEEEKYTVSALIERANKNVGQELDDPEIIEGDIAVDTRLRNADPCTSRSSGSCKWRLKNGIVRVPYIISSQYTPLERATILWVMDSFARNSCIRFVPYPPRPKSLDHLYIKSSTGCWSYVGRRGRRQIVSLSRQGCLHFNVIQHQLLHVLGFHHELSRSDRDMHVRILYENLRGGGHFKKIKTNNLGTPYDYGSVMQHSRYAFSRNGKPTIVPIPDTNVPIGKATHMSHWDIIRIQRLYGCVVRPKERRIFQLNEFISPGGHPGFRK
ncbi:low choriolytic enzyme-like [Sardina pilchardus]|uniref:low choriolytic enzyme-like n=1 Tax=Sardina pilchardus TaxID=27697 RepID=UPI002E118FA7